MTNTEKHGILELQSYEKELQQGCFEYGIYEVYYNEEDKAIASTKNSLTPTRDSKEELKIELEIMMEAFEQETLPFDDSDREK